MIENNHHKRDYVWYHVYPLNYIVNKNMDILPIQHMATTLFSQQQRRINYNFILHTYAIQICAYIKKREIQFWTFIRTIYPPKICKRFKFYKSLMSRMLSVIMIYKEGKNGKIQSARFTYLCYKCQLCCTWLPVCIAQKCIHLTQGFMTQPTLFFWEVHFMVYCPTLCLATKLYFGG